MAWPISKAGEQVIQLLKAHRISIDAATVDHLRSQRDAKLLGYNCMVANVMSLSTFRLRVNMEWFKPDRADKSKPRMENTSSRAGFDFQLIPTNGALYAIYYLSLRDYTLQLELDRDRWFKDPWWGISVNENEGTFVWADGNKRSFPLTPICCPQALRIREKQYLIDSNKR